MTRILLEAVSSEKHRAQQGRSAPVQPWQWAAASKPLPCPSGPSCSQAILPKPSTHSEQIPTHIKSHSSYKQDLAFSYRWCSGTSVQLLWSWADTGTFLQYGTMTVLSALLPLRMSQLNTLLAWHWLHVASPSLQTPQALQTCTSCTSVHPEWHMSFTKKDAE